MIVNPTLCGSCYWEITSAGVLNVYGSDEDVDEYVLDAWTSYPPWYDYRTQIKEVRVESDYVCPQTLYRAFYGCSALTTVVIKCMDLSYCTTLGYMFRGCVNLTSVTFSNFDTSTITNMASMFYNCQSLTSLNLLEWDTSSVTTMASMFRGCTALASLIMSGYSDGIVGWDTSALMSAQYMFYNCQALTAIDLNSFNVSALENTSYMFYGCSSLTTIYAGDWTSEAVNIVSSSYMFSGCAALEGAISYNGSKLTIAYANYDTGYFTDGALIIGGTTSGGSAGGGEYGSTSGSTSGSGATSTGSSSGSTTSSTAVSNNPGITYGYESASGDVVDFNGDTLWIQEPETLFKSVWQYDSYDSAYGGGKVTRFYRPVEESDEVSLEVVADSYSDYIGIVEDAHDIFESDIRNLTPGRLWVGDSYRECYIHSRSYEDFDEVLASATLDVSALYTGESWIEEHIFEADTIASKMVYLTSAKGIMRPVDVDIESPARLSINIHTSYPAYPVITFYGPAENPWVAIGNEFYQCRQTIYSGEYIIYDARNRTVTGYIESAREPDENSYSVGVPDDWESGLTLYRAVMLTALDGGVAFKALSDTYAQTISDVILSIETSATYNASYITISDTVTLGSGSEKAVSYGMQWSSYYEDYNSMFKAGIDFIYQYNPYTTIELGGTYIGFDINTSKSVTLAVLCVDLDYFDIDDVTAAGIGFALVDAYCDSVQILISACAYDDSGDYSGTGSSAVLTVPAGGYAAGQLDLSGADCLLMLFATSETLVAGETVTIAGGYLTPAEAQLADIDMAYACDSVGEKNWFEYRNLDLDAFNPVEPGEHNVYFESDLSFDLTILEERSEPSWPT